MAAGNWLMFGHALEQIIAGAIDVDSDVYRMALLTDAYTPDQSAHDAWSDMSAHQVANGDGYVTHGLAVSLTVARTGLAVSLDCADQTWSSATITAKYAVIVRDANADNALAAGDIPIMVVDLDTGGGSLSKLYTPGERKVLDGVGDISWKVLDDGSERAYPVLTVVDGLLGKYANGWAWT